MNRKMLMKLAISGFVLGAVSTGCSSTGQMAAAPANAAATPDVAAKSADKARTAIEQGHADKAVAFAEAAVAGSPREAGYRALLGQAYLKDGRFTSAAAALGEAMELGADDGNTIIALALAQIAQGKAVEAAKLLGAHQDKVPASDTGLAMALAGDSESAIYMLSEAARAPGADARTRQNLALAFALSGRWAQARILASQDMSPDKLEGRMAEWSKLAEQPNAQFRVANLIGAKVQSDAGMPVRLALGNFADTQMAAVPAAVELASADPAPIAVFAPPPPVMADASSAIRAAELPQPDSAGEVILADAAPYRTAPRVAVEASEGLGSYQQQALDLATRVVPAAMGFDSKNPSGWAVQLGAYNSLGIAKEKWDSLKRRNNMLAKFPASSHAATVNGRIFYRLTVNGLATRADATSLCKELKAQGQTCFARQMGGSENIQWAAKGGATRMASR